LGYFSNWLDYVLYLDNHPEIKAINMQYKRNEGYQKSLQNDKL